MIETLREQRRTWEDVERAAAESDLVFFQLFGRIRPGRFPEEAQERAGAILGAWRLRCRF